MVSESSNQFTGLEQKTFFPSNKNFSRFYELASQYYQMEGDHGEYYRNSLKYLGVIDLSKMNQSEQQSKAFSLGISALLASVSYYKCHTHAYPILERLQYGRAVAT